MKSVQQRAMSWIINGEVGISSKTIWAVMMGAVEQENEETDEESEAYYDYPYDPDDFRRCRLLLDLFPEWKERLPEVAAAFPEWAGLVANWDKLDALYDEESPSGQAPKLYDLMQELIP